MVQILNKAKPLLIAALIMLGFTSFVPNHRGHKLRELGVMKVVLDAGHGGHDPGNLGTGRYKTTEKDIALDVALKVGEYIQRAFPDVDVVYTRKEDKFVTLKDRPSIANKATADLFISIHCNSAESKAAVGTETFFMGIDKVKSNIELARRENSVILLEENYEQVYGGFDPNDPDALIVRRVAQSVYMNQSASLCSKIQDQYVNRVGRVGRGVKQAGYWVISYTTMPSVLTELGFLTNSAEEDFLNSENGKVFMASAIYRAFKEYKAEIEGVQVSTPAFESELPERPTAAVEPAPDKGSTEASNKETAEKETGSQAAAKSESKDEQVVFRIQLTASSSRIPLKPENFKGLEDVDEHEVQGLYKYTVGEVTDFEKAVSLQRTVRENAYPDAFIVAFYQGERIPISRALEISKTK